MAHNLNIPERCCLPQSHPYATASINQTLTDNNINRILNRKSNMLTALKHVIVFNQQISAFHLDCKSVGVDAMKFGGLGDFDQRLLTTEIFPMKR